MHTFTRSLVVLPAFVLAVAAAGAAQQAPGKLPTGTWSGKVTPQDQSPIHITLEVAEKAEGLEIAVTIPQRGTFKAASIKLETDRLAFSIVPGAATVICSLNKQADASYVGDCTDDGGETVRLVM